MATVYLSSDLSRVAGVDSVEIDAPRVHELILALVHRYPALESHLTRLAVAVDGEIYNDADYVPLTAASEVHLVPRIAGGTIPHESVRRG